MATFGMFEDQILKGANSAEAGILGALNKPSTVSPMAMQNAFSGQAPQVNQNINIQIDGSKEPSVTGGEVKKAVSDAYYSGYKGRGY